MIVGLRREWDLVVARGSAEKQKHSLDKELQISVLTRWILHGILSLGCIVVSSFLKMRNVDRDKNFSRRWCVRDFIESLVY